MATAAIKGKTWDEVQNFVRQYAKKHNLEILPKNYLPLKEAWCTSLDIYRPGALANLASFFPYFCGDGETLKHVKVKFEAGHGIEDLLSQFKQDPESTHSVI